MFPLWARFCPPKKHSVSFGLLVQWEQLGPDQPFLPQYTWLQKTVTGIKNPAQREDGQQSQAER